jgi:hypothetical protein
VFRKGSRAASVDAACFGTAGELALSLLVSLLSSFFFFRLAWASSRLAAHATAEALCAQLSQVARDKFYLVALRALRVAEQKEALFFSGVFFLAFAFPCFFGPRPVFFRWETYLKKLPHSENICFAYTRVCVKNSLILPFLLFQTFSLQA